MNFASVFLRELIMPRSKAESIAPGFDKSGEPSYICHHNRRMASPMRPVTPKGYFRTSGR